MIPSLVWICSRVLARYADQLPVDILRNYDSKRSDLLCGALDPPLCATLVQLYDNLPQQLHSLTLPLAHPHIPLLQAIPNTSLFSLITILDLPACPHLTDSSIIHLSALHSLVALDASATALSSYGIKVLAETLLWVDEGPRRRGPWPLRILRLRFCRNVDDTVYNHLAKFPLLAAIDLRGTSCRPPQDILTSFRPSLRMEFFHPAPLAVAVEALSRKDVHSSENHLKLVVDSLGRSTLFVPTRHPTFSPQNFESSHYLEQNKTGLIKALDDGSFSSTDDLNIERIQSHLQSHEQHPAPFEPVPQLSNLAFQSDPSMFYSQSESSHRPTKYDLVNDYNAKTYYNWAHLEIVARPAASHDEKLALYRIPPTWTTLEEHCAFLLKQMHTRSQHAQTAILVPAINRTQRTFQIGQARIEALRKSASTRRKSGVGPIIGTQSGTSNKVSSPGSVLGKNPFRRQSLGQSPSNPDCAIKSLKPISAMQVPELPLDLQNSVVMVNMAENTQSRPDLTTNTEMKLDPSLVTKLGHRPRLAGFDSAWSGSEQRTSAKKRSQSIGSRDAKKARAENGAEPDSKKRKQKDKGDVAKKGFDWSAWGTK